MASYIPAALTSWWTTPSDATPPGGLLSAAKLPPAPPTKLDKKLEDSASAHGAQLHQLLGKALASNRKLEQQVAVLEEEASQFGRWAAAGRRGGWTSGGLLTSILNATAQVQLRRAGADVDKKELARARKALGDKVGAHRLGGFGPESVCA